MGKIYSHRELIIYQKAFEAAMEIFHLTRRYPKEENYSMIDQIRRSSRSVAANLAEAFRKRQYPKMFISKMSDVESEAAETQVWLEFSRECQYLDQQGANQLISRYNDILNMAVEMRTHPEKWLPL